MPLTDYVDNRKGWCRMLRIYATGSDGIEFEITDLYWFEENFVHNFSDERSFCDRYKFRFEWDGEELRTQAQWTTNEL